MKTNKFLVSIFGAWIFASVLAGQVPLNQNPTRVVGQSTINPVSFSPNLAEAQDLASPSSVAIDSSYSPPAIYVADAVNNRVLGWKNATGFNNGAPADIVVGQADFVSTRPAGPGTSFSTGLSSPNALAVDTQGNLYVADAGNNRILRFPRPFDQADQRKLPDQLIIGQANFNSNNTNAGGLVAANTIALNVGGTVNPSALVFDSNGNLWFSDAGNNRVLRYPLIALQRGQSQPGADVVLGQPTFTTSGTTPGGDPRTKTILTGPAGLAFDSASRLYVCDNLNRVLVYSRLTTGSPADRVMGVYLPVQGQTPLPAVNEIQLGRFLSNGQRFPPQGVFTIGTVPFVIDTPSNRILRYDPLESWPPESQQFSPSSRQTIGQVDSVSFKLNGGQPEASNSVFDTPVSAAVANNEVYLADNGNNRVLVFPISGNTISTASRVLGQTAFYQTSPNSIDGREMWLLNGGTTVGAGTSFDGAGVVIDSSSNPPRLYVADTYNNRILGFKDARNTKPGDRADIVIGQRDLTRALINNPTNDPAQQTDSGLYLPGGLAVDGGGSLYVADAGNGRVLRFPRPFEQSGNIRPDIVLGQSNFFTRVSDPTARTMARPYGLAFTTAGNLLVSDIVHSRVLLFTKPDGGDFSSGQAASKVIGQPDFSTSTAVTGAGNRMVAPHGIATDTDDRLYVCDTGNNRVLVYDSIPVAGDDPFPALPLNGIGSPHGIAVSQTTGEIWVASATAGVLYRLPFYLKLLFDPRNDFSIPTRVPLGVALDPFGNLVATDGYNRVAFYFPNMLVSNGANQLANRLAPYTYTTLKPVPGGSFGDTTLSFKDLPDTPPMPTSLADIQVAVNDVAAPMQAVSPTEIDFVMPQGTAPSNNVQLVVSRRSTSQVLAATTISVAPYGPALFTLSPDGSGQLMAKNPDGGANGPSDPVGRSQTISLFGTGFGYTGGLPADGAAATDKVEGAGVLRVLIGTDFAPPENVTYFGLAPGLVAVWQIDVKVPDKVAPDPQVPITCSFNSIPCNSDGVNRRLTYIGVKP